MCVCVWVCECVCLCVSHNENDLCPFSYSLLSVCEVITHESWPVNMFILSCRVAFLIRAIYACSFLRIAWYRVFLCLLYNYLYNIYATNDAQSAKHISFRLQAVLDNYNIYEKSTKAVEHRAHLTGWPACHPATRPSADHIRWFLSARFIALCLAAATTKYAACLNKTDITLKIPLLLKS